MKAVLHERSRDCASRGSYSERSENSKSTHDSGFN